MMVTVGKIVRRLDEMILNRGPMDEILLDNSNAFCSEILRETLDKCNIKQLFRTAYKPNGN